jgi:hypothetical protein
LVKKNKAKLKLKKNPATKWLQFGNAKLIFPNGRFYCQFCLPPIQFCFFTFSNKKAIVRKGIKKGNKPTEIPKWRPQHLFSLSFQGSFFVKLINFGLAMRRRHLAHIHYSLPANKK